MNNDLQQGAVNASPTSGSQASSVPGPSAPAPSGRKNGLIIGIAVAVVALASVGAAAYLHVAGGSPDLRVAKALKAAYASKAFAYEGQVVVEARYKGESAAGLLPLLGADSRPEDPFKLTVDVMGAQDRLVDGSPKGRTSISVALDRLLDGRPFGALEIRNVGAEAFIALTSVPEIPSFDLTPLKSTWIKAGVSKDESSKAPTPEQLGEIDRAFLDIRPAHVSETLPSESVNGVLSDRYRIAVDQEKMKEFAKRVNAIMGSEEEPMPEGAEEPRSALPEDVEIRMLEIWVGKESGLPTRALLKMRVQDKEKTEFDGEVTLDATFSGFGEPVTVEAPKDAKEFTEVIGLLLGGGAPEGAMLTETRP